MGLKHLRLAVLGLTPFVMLFLSVINSTPASAQSTGEWVNSSTIRYEGKLYRDTNPGDTSYAFIQEGASRACINTTHGATRLVSNSRPSETSSSTFTHVNVTIQPTEPPCTSTRTAVTIGPAGSATGGGTSTGGAAEEGTDEVTCAIGNALGWIICPITEGLAHTTFLAADILEHFLYTEPLLLNAQANPDDARAGTYLVWSSVRNLANIILVFGFFAIVFSQATSMGISSYGIKRLLPRLVIVAILINLSYFICALAIDIFNIMGGSVAGFFSAANNAIPNTDDSEFGIANLLTSLMAGLGLAAGAYAFGGALFALAWPFVVPALVIVVTAVLTATVVLIFREVALVLLVIVSPLAFAAWLLPNTENWFSRWKSLFQNLLIMYPLMMALIYGSFLAYNILQATSGLNPFIMSLVGLIIVAMPLFSLPFLIKFAGNIGARIGAFTNNPNRGMIDRSKKWARSKSDLNKQEAKARYVQNQGPGAYTGNSRTGRVHNYLKNRKAGAQQYVGGYSSRKAFEEETRASEAKLAQARHVATEGRENEAFRQRAAGVGGDEGVSRVRSTAVAALADQQAQESRTKTKAIESIQQLFQGDHELAKAWVATGGGNNVTNIQAYDKLGQAQKDKIQELKDSGFGNQADSYNAALRLMANSGYGNGGDIYQAFKLMRDNGANVGEVHETSETVRSIYRSKGRGDLVGRGNVNDPNDNKLFKELGSTGGFEINWEEVKPESIVRHELKESPTVRASLDNYLATHQEYTRSLVASISEDRLADKRAQPYLQQSLANAWQGKTRTDGVKTYSADPEQIMQELRDDYKLNP